MNLFSDSSRLLLCALTGAVVAGCGGGQTSTPAAASSASAVSAAAPSQDTATLAALTTFPNLNKTPLPVTGTPVLPPSLQPTVPTTVSAADVVTDIILQSNIAAGTAQVNVPITFGQVFAAGDVPAGKSLIGRRPDGTALNLQVDSKVMHPDGSLRHAVISTVLPSLGAGESLTIGLARTAAPVAASATGPATLLAEGFSSSVNLVVDGQTYTASAENMLKGSYATWLSGAVTNEWLVAAPFRNAQGVAHPHLNARFAIRWYGAAKKTRVDVNIENDWAYEAGPKNFVYDAEILVGGKKVYSKQALTQYHHTRWRKMFWVGDTPEVHIRHNTSYLIASRAVPNYDQSIKISESFLKTLGDSLTTAKFEPMGTGVAAAYMPSTGGRIDIGLLPGWSVDYLLTMDKRAKDAMLRTADLAGSYSSHYRDRNTDSAVTVLDYPYMTILARATDTGNPKTGKLEAFPPCATVADCATPNLEDMAHQPGFAYLPYLVTGDNYYLEELLFWSMYNSFSSNPWYREYAKGLFAPDQVRGQGWSLRTAAQAAYITPTTHYLKKSVDSILNSNIDWYTAKYPSNPNANKLGIIMAFNDIEYGVVVQPWPDDHFTSAVGYTVELGFTRAKALLDWKAQYPVSRMVGAGACWIDAAIYNLTIRDSVNSPVYATIGEAYRASHTADFNKLACNSPEMAAALNSKVGEMTGYASFSMGYPSNLQPALAYSSSVTGATGASAWALFMSRTVKPDYSEAPQFAIIPR